MTSAVVASRDVSTRSAHDERHPVVVVGAGVTGLAAATSLARAGVDVVVCDAESNAGGVIRTTWSDGCMVEWGPHSMQGTPAVLEALDRLGLSGDIVPASVSARRRYVLRDGHPVALPAGPFGLLRSPLLTPMGKVRLLCEPLIGTSSVPDEKFDRFARRRFGAEVAERLVSAFVAGVYAADADEIGVEHAFPKLHQLEQAHGSLLRGAVREARAARRAGAVRPGSISFAQGMGHLTDSMARALGDALRLDMALVALHHDGDDWRLTFRRADGSRATLGAAAVVLSLPAHQLSQLDVPDDLRAHLATIGATPHAGVSVWTMSFRREDVIHPLDGFGVLVPSCERRTVLGALFSSSMFPGRCVEGQVVLSAFVRTTEDGTRASLGEVQADVHRILGVRGDPLCVEVHEHAGIPLKGSSHRAVLDAANQLEAEHPGLTLAGSWRSGVAVGECLVAGELAGARSTPRRC